MTSGAKSSAYLCAYCARSEFTAVVPVSTGETGLLIELAELMLVLLRANDKNDLFPLPDDLTLDSDTSDIALADVDDLVLPVGVVDDLACSASSANISFMMLLSMKVTKVSDTL